MTRQAPDALACRSVRTWFSVLTSSKPLNGRVSTASMPRFGSRASGCWGTVSTTTGILEPRVPQLLDQLRSLDLALEQQVDHHDVRPQLRRCLDDFRAVAEDLQQLHLRLHAQQVADVLTHLRHVFRDQESNGVGVGHSATISSPRGGSPPLARYQNGSFVMRTDRTQVVAAGDDLHLEPGRLGHGTQIVGVDQPQPVLAHPTAGRTALGPVFVDRGQLDVPGRRFVLRRGRL